MQQQQQQQQQPQKSEPDHQESHEEEEEEPQGNDAHDNAQEEEDSQQQRGATPDTAHKEMLPEECAVCLCLYREEERRPRSLPCGHSLCSQCIATLLKEDHLCCPTCLTVHQATAASQFPLNFALESMISRFRAVHAKGTSVTAAGKTKQSAGAGVGRRLQTLIKEQKQSLKSLGDTLKQELSHLGQYREELATAVSKHGHMLEELDKAKKQHQSAMKLLMEEDVKVEAFMEEGEKGHRDLRDTQAQLDCIISRQKACSVIDAADDSATVAEEWLQLSTEEFPNGTAYSTSCRVLEATETALQVALQDEDDSEVNPSGHPDCTITEMLKKIHERSVEPVRSDIKRKLRKVLESGQASQVKKDDYSCFSFSTFGSAGSKMSPTSTFAFKTPTNEAAALFSPLKCEAPPSLSSMFRASGPRDQTSTHRSKSSLTSVRRDATGFFFSTPTTPITTTTSNFIMPKFSFGITTTATTTATTTTNDMTVPTFSFGITTATTTTSAATTTSCTTTSTTTTTTTSSSSNQCEQQ